MSFNGKMKALDPELIRSLFDYDPITGILKWKTYRSGINSDRIVSSQDSRGYIVVKIDGSTYKAHRVIWAHYYGVWPVEEIDHQNFNHSDNSILNLKERTRAQNMMHSPVQIKSKSGIKGVTWFSSGKKWRADIRVNYKLIYLGLFDSIEEAATARKKAETLYFGEYA